MDAAHVRPAAVQDVSGLWRCDAIAQSHSERKYLVERAVQRQQCLVAECGGQIAGFAVLHHEFFEHTFISLVVVANEFRRRGIGLQLVRVAESSCRSPKLFSSTNASNRAAQEFLRKAGFSRCGVVENLDPGDPEYIYFKEVPEHEG